MIRTARAAVGVLAAMTLGVSNVHAGDAADPVEVVYKPQQIEFIYSSSSVSYSCMGIASKVSKVLKSIGARAGLKVRSANCGSTVSSTHWVQIQLEAPVEATPQQIQAMTTYDSRELLVARVRGESLPTSADVERFAGTWKPVSLSLDFQAGDCELVHELTQQVLPKLSVRVLSPEQYCPMMGMTGRPRLKVEALVPVSSQPL
jgi:hypothetical protein